MKERDIDREIIEETNREAIELVGEVEAIREINETLHNEVGRQGEDIEEIDKNVGKAHKNVERGNQDLVKSSEYACAARWKICIIVILVIVIIVVVLAAIGIAVGVGVSVSQSKWYSFTQIRNSFHKI